MKLTLLQGDVFEKLPEIPSESIDFVITSPPYWGLRSYGAGEKELGQEPTMEAYLDNTMRWVKEVWRVLKPTGNFVLNMGDCFCGSGKGHKSDNSPINPNHRELVPHNSNWKELGGFYKDRQLLSVSSFAYCRIVSETDFVCRGEHIWAKPNVPSPIRSRLKHSHEKLFWFVKDAGKYYFDKTAWQKPITESSTSRCQYGQHLSASHRGLGLSSTSSLNNTDHNKHLIGTQTIEHSWRVIPVGEKQQGFELSGKLPNQHVAPYPTKLIEPYILSLCPRNGTILDPFLGSGTTMRIAMENGRNCTGIELDEKCIPYIKSRVNWGAGIGVEYEEAKRV